MAGFIKLLKKEYISHILVTLYAALENGPIRNYLCIAELGTLFLNQEQGVLRFRLLPTVIKGKGDGDDFVFDRIETRHMFDFIIAEEDDSYHFKADCPPYSARRESISLIRIENRMIALEGHPDGNEISVIIVLNQDSHF